VHASEPCTLTARGGGQPTVGRDSTVLGGYTVLFYFDRCPLVHQALVAARR